MRDFDKVFMTYAWNDEPPLATRPTAETIAVQQNSEAAARQGDRPAPERADDIRNQTDNLASKTSIRGADDVRPSTATSARECCGFFFASASLLRKMATEIRPLISHEHFVRVV